MEKQNKQMESRTCCKKDNASITIHFFYQTQVYMGSCLWVRMSVQHAFDIYHLVAEFPTGAFGLLADKGDLVVFEGADVF